MIKKDNQQTDFKLSHPCGDWPQLQCDRPDDFEARQMIGQLRGDEEFVMDAVAKTFSGTWRCGEDPPDAYLDDR